MNPTDRPTELRDRRLDCKLCIRKSPNYCKRHAPRMTVRRIQMYTLEQLEARSRTDQRELLERLKEVVYKANNDLTANKARALLDVLEFADVSLARIEGEGKQ